MSLKHILILIMTLCSIQSHHVFSTEISPQKVMSFRHLSIKDGLTQSGILDIAQDNQGFLWFATYDGLNRYDGYNFTVYPHSESIATSLSDNHINVLYVNKQNELWVGTNKGLNVFNPLDETFNHIELDLGKAMPVIRAIYQDYQNNMWLGTNKGLYYQDKSTQSFKQYHDSTFDRNNEKELEITSIIEDHDKKLWVGSEKNGLYRINQHRKTSVNYLNNVNISKSISNNKITTLYETNDNELWVGTLIGLKKYDKSANSFDRYIHDPSNKNSISNNRTHAIYEDPKGILWVGTERGLNKFDRDNNSFIHFFHNVSDPNSLSSDVVKLIYEDTYGLLVICISITFYGSVCQCECCLGWRYLGCFGGFYRIFFGTSWFRNHPRYVNHTLVDPMVVE